MRITIKKTTLAVITLCLAMTAAETFAQKEQHKHERPANLQVLPQDISIDSLINVMHDYSKSLGVRCGYCHEAKQGADGKPDMDFASDAKPEKQIARDMMRMTAAINTNYLSKIGGEHPLSSIGCVTCHNGRPNPITTVDSLMKQ